GAGDARRNRRLELGRGGLSSEISNFAFEISEGSAPRPHPARNASPPRCAVAGRARRPARGAAVRIGISKLRTPNSELRTPGADDARGAPGRGLLRHRIDRRTASYGLSARRNESVG